MIGFGPLNTEMAYLCVLKDLLESSGWTTVIMTAGVT